MVQDATPLFTPTFIINNIVRSNLHPQGIKFSQKKRLKQTLDQKDMEICEPVRKAEERKRREYSLITNRHKDKSNGYQAKE